MGKEEIQRPVGTRTHLTQKGLAMTKGEFKALWESPAGDTVTFDDVADLAVEWGISDRPKTRDIMRVLYEVLCEAGCTDAEEYNPSKEEYGH